MAGEEDGGRVHKGGEGTLRRIFFDLKVPKGKPILWFHCASVGEFNTARPIIRAFRKDYSILLTYFSPRAEDYLRRQENYYDLLHPLPLDLPPLVKSFERTVNPKALIILERELWYSLIKFTKTKKALINAYSKGGFMERCLSKELDLIITRTKEDAHRFASYGAKRVVPCANLKFVLDAQEREVHPKTQGRFIVAGSTHRGEEELLLEVFLRLKGQFKDLRLVLAPRHMDRIGELEHLLIGLNYSLRSQEKPDWDILLVDTLGELFYLYKLGEVCFVGGTFAKVGGHNLLEPAYWGKPVVFGPYTHKVRDMEEFLLRSGAGFKVKDIEELYAVLKGLLTKGFDAPLDLRAYSDSVKDCYLRVLKEFLL